MGRSPCCDKVGLKKGPWTPEEDQKLLAYIEEHGHGSWRALPSKAGLQRCGKSCRLRWTNYLRPDIKRGKFNLQEEKTIIQLHALLGNRWSAIATHLPKRTDNEIKNYWNTHLKKRLTKMGIDPVTHKPKNDAILSGNDGHSKSTANLSHIAQWESARLEAEARLVRQSKLGYSSLEIANTSSEIAQPPMVATNKQLVGPSLDILKAWNGIWTKEAAAADIDSPKSGVSYSTATAGIGESSSSFIEMMGNSTEDGILLMKEEEWGGGFRNILNFGNYNNYYAHVPNNGNKFTDLLVNINYNSGDWSFSDGDGETDNGGDHEGRGGDEYEADKNYWNGILNLVDTTSPTPSDSPPLS